MMIDIKLINQDLKYLYFKKEVNTQHISKTLPKIYFSNKTLISILISSINKEWKKKKNEQIDDAEHWKLEA